jgi:Bax protein
MREKTSDHLSKFKGLTPNFLYGLVFTVIALGTIGTQTGIFSLPIFKGPPPPYTGPLPSPSQELRAITASALRLRFENLGYTLDAVRSGKSNVPRIYLTELPKDLSQLTSVKERKDLFLLSLLPMILRVNERLAADRTRLQRIQGLRNSKETVSQADAKWLAEAEKIYAVESGGIRSLMSRLDEIPISLALAQAVTESGWGTSRFARMGNALFGQWTANRNVAGMAPAGRGKNKKHRVRAFKSLIRSVWKYALNLNNHPAYRSFREDRAAARQNSRALSGVSLTHALTQYSERGIVYTEELRTIIRVNRLHELDGVKLRQVKPTS